MDNSSKASKIDSIISCIAIIGFVVMLLLFLFKKNKSNSNTSAISQYEFTNLKNDLNIPTLSSCRSLDINLKNMLQRQMNVLNARPNLLEEVGIPTFGNRFILAGPPGTGKTFFSKIYSKTIDAEYLEILYSDINSRWVGEDIEKMDAIFKKIINTAKNNSNKKYVVTFNEIDSLLLPLEQLVSNGGTNFASLRRERSAFITYLDRLAEETPNVIIIGTTNMKPNTKNLDSALMSRFSDNILEIDYPDKNCLYEAMKNSLSKIKNIDDFIINNSNDMEKLSEIMYNRKFSYRNLESVINNAKIAYLEDKMHNQNEKFKFEYLNKAQELLTKSDGERKL